MRISCGWYFLKEVGGEVVADPASSLAISNKGTNLTFAPVLGDKSLEGCSFPPPLMYEALGVSVLEVKLPFYEFVAVFV